MTTNEIAAAVQAGQADILELWEAVQRFAHDRAYRWTRAAKGRGGVVLDDLVQCAFIALLDAVQTWRPDSGASFIGWYSLKLKAAFTEATGQRTERTRQDPLDRALSLDMPLLDGNLAEDLTLADVIEDPRSEEEIEAVAELDYQQRRKQALATALDGLTEDQRRAVVLRHCHGLTLDQTAARMGTTRAAARTAEQKGLRLLRHPINRELRMHC
jgi:RNA polymerase sigma factor (sigma-70 family)